MNKYLGNCKLLCKSKFLYRGTVTETLNFSTLNNKQLKLDQKNHFLVYFLKIKNKTLYKAWFDQKTKILGILSRSRFEIGNCTI